MVKAGFLESGICGSGFVGEGGENKNVWEAGTRRLGILEGLAGEAETLLKGPDDRPS